MVRNCREDLTKLSGGIGYNLNLHKCTKARIPRLLCFLDSNCHENPETQPVSLSQKRAQTPQRTTWNTHSQP